MRIEIGRTIRNFVIFVAILMVMVPGVLASEPSYSPPSGAITVDGNSGEWDLKADLFADMYKAAKSDDNHEMLSKLYLRYNCTDGILYAMVLLKSGHVIDDNQPDNQFIKVNESGKSKIVVKLVDASTGDNDIAPDFHYISNGADKIGWEASTYLPPGSYRLNVHTQVNDDDTSAVAYREIPLEIYCDGTDIPEFPTVALPIAAILGLMFIFGRKRDL